MFLSNISIYLGDSPLSSEVFPLALSFRDLGYTIRIYCGNPLNYAPQCRELQFIHYCDFKRINELNDSPILISTEMAVFNPLPNGKQFFFWDIVNESVSDLKTKEIIKISNGVNVNSLPLNERGNKQEYDFPIIAQKWVDIFEIKPENLILIEPSNSPKQSTFKGKICWVVSFPDIYKDSTENPSFRILCKNQSDYFNSIGIKSDITDRLDNKLFNYDVLIFARFGKEEYSWIKKLKEVGKKTIFLHDENLFNFAYLEDTWELVDVVACTSQALIDKVKERINRDDHLFLNDRNFDTINKSYYHAYTREHPIVGWCGLSGSNLIRNVIKPICKRNAFRLEVLSDTHSLRADLTTRVWKLNTWVDHLNQFDIFVAPQNHQLYAKSHAKIALPAFLGIPILASPLSSYKRIIKHGKSGFICETIEDWEHYLTILKDPKLRKEIGQAARKQVLNYYGNSYATQNWINLFQKLGVS